jgi:hypothetical protein
MDTKDIHRYVGIWDKPDGNLMGSSLFSVGRDTEIGSSEVKHGDEVIG